MSAFLTDCRYFTGYKPCAFRRPCGACPHFEARGPEVLLINLDGLGDVVRNTALVPALRRALPGCRLTWLTRPGAAPLLEGHPGVQRVLPLGPSTTAVLGALRFDLALNADKSVEAGSLVLAAGAGERRGFGIDGHGTVVPLNPEAHDLWAVGLDDHAKFFEDRRSHPERLARAFGLEWRRDPPLVELSPAEVEEAARLRAAWAPGGEVVLGFNTGCAPWLPYKRLTVEDTAAVVAASLRACARRGVRARGALLGGGEADRERNRAVAARLASGDVVETPTGEGLRRGLLSIAACHAVFSGDTLGLHAAIALGKPVVAWFGVTSHGEVDLHGRGVHVLADVACRPCWQPGCDRPVKCYARVPLGAAAEALAEMAEAAARGEVYSGEGLIGAFPHPETDVAAHAARWGRGRQTHGAAEPPGGKEPR
ncbi:glycosyltransferase family 9 protein [Myxococcota bacterium]|nr:glycosyltransferase family 9 protein [Myxococcota bacterium]